MKPIDKIIGIVLNIKVASGILLILMVTASDAQTISQERQSRHKIRSFITVKYPEARSVWILDGYWGYRVTFKTQDGKYVSSFSLKDEWLQTERKVNITDIPDSVKQSLKNSKYSKAKILMAKKLMLPQEPVILYLVEVRSVDSAGNTVELGNIRDYKLYFTGDGRLTKVEEEPGESIQNMPWGGQ